MRSNWKITVEDSLSEVFGEPIVVQDASSIGGGCINNSLRLVCNVGTFFLKWNNSGSSDLFLREAESLRTLYQATTELIIPKVITATEITTDSPGIIVIDFLRTDNSDSKQKDEKMGVGLAQLHRVTNAQYGFSSDNYCGETLQNNHWNSDWVSFFAEQRIWYLVKKIEQVRGLDKSEMNTYERFVNKLFTNLGHNPKASLTHGDLWSGNYMYTDKGPALIDPACYFADRECDLALMKMFGGFSQSVWNSYQAIYPLEKEWEERIDIYQLYHYLNHYLIFGGNYGMQAMMITQHYV